jgi:hypothetical protein
MFEDTITRFFRPKKRTKRSNALEIKTVELNTKWLLGRPFITLAIDEGTKATVGAHVGMSCSESCLGLLSKIIFEQYLRHVNKPKSYVRENYPEIMNSWDSHGVPETPAVDDSKEDTNEKDAPFKGKR